MNKKSNSDDPTSVEFWEKLGIKPIVIDTSTEEGAKKGASEVAERIKEAVEEIKEQDQ